MIGARVSFNPVKKDGTRSSEVLNGVITDKVFAFLFEKYVIVEEKTGQFYQVPTSHLVKILPQINIESNQKQIES